MTEFSYFWNGTTVGDASAAPYNADTEFAGWSRKGFGVGASRNDAGVVLGTGSESTQLDALQVTQNSPAAMSVLLNIGCALVNGTLYTNDAAVTLAIAANASGNPRIDTIVLRKSWAAQTVRAAVLQGTTAASPVPPTLTQSAGVTWEIPIADIAVANAASSITTANITPRALYTSAADGIYLDRLLNNSGAVRQTGDAVILDTGADRAFNTSALFNSNLALGIVAGRIPAAGYGRVLNRGIGYVKTLTGVTRGQYAGIGTTAGSVDSSGTQRLVNTIAQFLETTSVAGEALAYIEAGLKPNFGQLIQNTTLNSSGVNIDNLPQFYSVYTIEIVAASAIAATSETMNFQFGSAGGAGQRDGTAGNYYSYAGFIANSVAAVSAVQNLGATAAWQLTIPGSTATNPAFYAVIQIKGVNNSANIKVGTGTAFLKIGNANGNLSVINFGGLWSNVAKALEQIQMTTVGGNTLSGQVNIYGKNGVTI